MKEPSIKLNWDEVQVYVNMVADFYEDNGRDPNKEEWPAMASLARKLAARGKSRLE